MTEPPEGYERANAYLKQRVAQLVADIADLNAENDRLRQAAERLHGRQAARRPDPLGGEQ